MTTGLLTSELRALRKRMAELEAAAELRGLAPDSADASALAEVCQVVGLGVRVAQSSSRVREAAEKRAVIVRVLRANGWTVERIALVLRKTERAVYRMTRRGTF